MSPNFVDKINEQNEEFNFHSEVEMTD